MAETVNSAKAETDGRVRKYLHLQGILQGIGCRPTVYRLASEIGLGGWVINSMSGVRIEVEGTPDQCRAFEERLPAAIPYPGRIDSLDVREIAALGETAFRIESSVADDRSGTPIPPDVAVCPDCVTELFDPTNPRYLYPFITCTLCGPRFTVARSFPYDRERTAMADFTMCARCEAEYHDPGDRRFHSQTNSCASCGPSLTLTDSSGAAIAGDPIVETVRLLMDGTVVAIKGIGGFHLACDALNPDAVGLLRDRKGRMEKPFAIMAPNVETVRRYCRVGPEEETALRSPSAPVVLMTADGRSVAENVAPYVGTLGVMLPYAPVHHLLFRCPDIPEDYRPQVLVMTSGNRSEEPICRDNAEALERLCDLADAFLFHDREIVLPADDSIVRVIGGRPTVFRRSRGLVPAEFDVSDLGLFDRDDPAVILGAGGDLKNVIAVVKGNRAVPGPHVGDLESPVAQEYFKKSAAVLTEYLEAAPTIIAVDPHPEYFSATLAVELPADAEQVFHHHAHAASLMVEHGRSDPAFFAVFDGTGYGVDGTVWGGEFLIASLDGFQRVGHIGQYVLPGGETAIREPARIAAILLAENGVLSPRFSEIIGPLRDRIGLILEAAAKGINAPVTSSAGRLFDAAAAVAGFHRRVTFEGQAAMWLEAIADSTETGEYPIETVTSDPFTVDPSGLIRALAEDLPAGVSKEIAAARFHNTMARTIVQAAEAIARPRGLDTIGLTGGCFQNKLLTERAAVMLEKAGFTVLRHGDIPPNDGGIALGQAVVAAARRKSPESGRE